MQIGLKEVAAAAGVSIATVSRVMAGQSVRPAYRARVEAALAALDYRPNLAARRLRRRSGDLIGLVVPDIANPFFNALALAIEEMAWREGLRVLLANSNEDAARERRLLTMLGDERVAGIILAAAGDAPALPPGTPVVLVDRVVEIAHASADGSAAGVPDSVAVDNAAAAAALVAALHARGHRRILGLFAAGGGTAPGRRRGFEAAGRHHALSLRSAAIPHEPAARTAAVAAALAGTGTGAEEGAGPDDAPCDALVCGNALILLEAAALARAGTRAVAPTLAGFDEAPWTRLLPADTIVLRQPVEEIAHAALALLVARIAGAAGAALALRFHGRIAPPRG